MSERNQGENGVADTSMPFWKVMFSVMRACFGVQSRANKERDFANGSFKGFIAAALIFTAVFILTLVSVVSLVLP